MNQRVRASEFNAQIYEEACAWFIDMRAGDVDAVGRQRFDAWARKSPEHLRAYLEVSEIWDDVPLVDRERKLSPENLIARARASAEVIPLAGVSPNRTTAEVSRAKRGGTEPFMGRRRFAVAAGVALVCGIVAATGFQLYRAAPYATGIGEQRTLTLGDGSRVEMNSRTRLRVRLTEKERTIDLLEGQAFFRVAKNPQRPFIVRSADTQIRAVGTQFDVYKKPAGTVVTVVEGKVAVFTPMTDFRVPTDAANARAPERSSSPSNGEEGRQVRSGENPRPLQTQDVSFLSAGEQLTVTVKAVSRPVHANVAAATAWTHGTLVFDGSRLADVVEEFNRYNERQLTVRDPSLADIRISGVYSSTDPALLVRFLREQPGIRIDETGSATVISAR